MTHCAEIETGAPSMEELKAVATPHHCFSVQELCHLRQGAELPLVATLRVLYNLGTGCPACWQAIEEARGVPPQELAPTVSPAVRLLRTLTVLPSEDLRSSHRKAAQQASTAPFGILRLLFEEVLVVNRDHPAAAIDELESVMALLGDLPAEALARRAWHDLHADLEAHIAVAWAQRQEPSRATAALERTAVHREAGSRDAEGAVTLLIARADCELHRHAEVAAWLPRFEEALELLYTGAHQPRRLEVLHDLGGLLAEEAQFEAAHSRFLEALRIAGEIGVNYPVLNLGVLHYLVKLEMRIALDAHEDPPTFGLFFSLAMIHFQQAAGLYEKWGNQALVEEGENLGRLLVLEGAKWATPSGLRQKWQELVQHGAVQALPAVELLGLAASGGDGQFVADHAAEARRAFAESAAARTRLRGFQQDLQRLRECVDEGSLAAVISPWMEVMELVEGVAGHA